MDKFKDDFKLIPFSIVYIFDTPRDQLDILNKLISHCIQKHVPLKKVKFPGPPAHWTKNICSFCSAEKGKRSVPVWSTFS